MAVVSCLLFHLVTDVVSVCRLRVTSLLLLSVCYLLRPFIYLLRNFTLIAKPFTHRVTRLFGKLYGWIFDDATRDEAPGTMVISI